MDLFFSDDVSFESHQDSNVKLPGSGVRPQLLHCGPGSLADGLLHLFAEGSSPSLSRYGPGMIMAGQKIISDIRQ